MPSSSTTANLADKPSPHSPETLDPSTSKARGVRGAGVNDSSASSSGVNDVNAQDGRSNGSSSKSTRSNGAAKAPSPMPSTSRRTAHVERPGKRNEAGRGQSRHSTPGELVPQRADARAGQHSSPAPHGSSADVHPSGIVSSATGDVRGPMPPQEAGREGGILLHPHESDSSLLARPPPSLPYDPSYPPLSPSGVDQAGHSVALKYGAAKAQGGKSSANGSSGPSARAGAGSLANTLGSERPKKTLAGEELETHLISEVPGQRPMPWGLQSTLKEKSRNLPRGKTRMGTQKRNAPRQARSQNGAEQRLQTPQTIKVEDEAYSEMSSPALGAMEIDFDETARERGAESNNTTGTVQYASTLVNGGPSTTKSTSGRKSRKQMAAFPNTDKARPLSDSSEAADSSYNAGAEPSSSVQSRSSPPTLPGDDASAGFTLSDDGADADVSAADITMDTAANGTSRRPRAAHKRLKMIGGYYGKGRQDNVDSDADEGASTLQAPSATDIGGSELASRATSVATIAEEDGADRVPQVLVDDADASNVVIAPSTPVKTSQQPSLGLGLRDSATKRQATKLNHAGTRNDDDDENNPFCDTCNGIGHFICCDGCPRSFHFACINPPLDIDELPPTFNDEDDQWFCNVCRASKQPKGKRAKGVWAPLIQKVEDSNPTIFSLPQDIRGYFKGVATASDGSYVDSTMLKPLKVNKLGVVDERDPLRLKDKNGKLVLCYRCGQSALPPSRDSGRERDIMSKDERSSDMSREGWRKLITCDFCSLSWHLDCLEPPMASMPSLTRKWMCPNHIEHVVRPERVPKNAANSQSVHDLPLPSLLSVGPGKHYRTRVVNDGHIDIIPDPMDTYFGGSNSNNTSADGNGHVAPASALAGSGSENRGRGLDRGWEEVDIPGAQARGASGNPSNALSANAPHIRFKYRLPEKVIRVDFWTRAELERKQASEELALRAQERSRASLDLLASIAAAGAVSSEGAEELGVEKKRRLDMSAESARELVAKAFGSGASFAYQAVPARRADEYGQSHALPSQGQGSVTESFIRDTYVDGEFEREFLEIEPKPPVRQAQKRMPESLSNADDGNQRPAEMNADNVASDGVSMKPETSDAKALSADLSATKGSSAASKTADSLGIDIDELAQLRALKELVSFRGADALLDFVMQGKNATREDS